MGTFHIYDPDKVTVSFAGQTINGWADGEYVRIEQESDDFSDTVTTDGNVTRSKTNDRRATVTFILLQSSLSNEVLSYIRNAGINGFDTDGNEATGVGALVIKDLNGNSIFQAENAWISKPPDISFDREPGSREWTIRCAQLVRFDGGN